jgi:stress response protein YsnF
MTYNKFENNKINFEENLSQLAPASDISQEIIPLLEERLVADFTQRKMSEIVVRKVVETKVINIKIPVRSEKLIVEQISPCYKQLAIVESEDQNPLSEEEFNRKYASRLRLDNISKDDSIANDTSLFETVIKGEFNSIEDAHEFLNLIFHQIPDVGNISTIELILRRSNIGSQLK